MERNSTYKLLLPVGLFLIMLLDGQITMNMRAPMINESFLNSHLLLIGLIVGGMGLSKRYMLVTSTILGLLFDIYYYGIVGINMAVLPATVLLIHFVFEYVPVNIISIILSLIVFTTIMEGSAYLLQVIFNLRRPDFLMFLVNNLGPTLIFNVFLCLVLSYPITKFIKKPLL